MISLPKCSEENEVSDCDPPSEFPRWHFPRPGASWKFRRSFGVSILVASCSGISTLTALAGAPSRSKAQASVRDDKWFILDKGRKLVVSLGWVIGLPSIYTLTALTVTGSAWPIFMLTQVPPLGVLPRFAFLKVGLWECFTRVLSQPFFCVCV
eukprot:COSAG02_NODE_7830_length_2831_cov_1.410322_2_plen_153_part_00